MKMKNLALMSLMTIALLGAACGGSTTPIDRGPKDMAVQPTVDASQPDQSSVQPMLISVSPNKVQVGTSPNITITGNAEAKLDQQQGGTWSFGSCPINSYTWSPVDASHCVLQPAIPQNAPTQTCNLSLKRSDGKVLTLMSAFQITP